MSKDEANQTLASAASTGSAKRYTAVAEWHIQAGVEIALVIEGVAGGGAEYVRVIGHSFAKRIASHDPVTAVSPNDGR